MLRPGRHGRMAHASPHSGYTHRSWGDCDRERRDSQSRIIWSGWGLNFSSGQSTSSLFGLTTNLFSVKHGRTNPCGGWSQIGFPRGLARPSPSRKGEVASVCLLVILLTFVTFRALFTWTKSANRLFSRYILVFSVDCKFTDWCQQSFNVILVLESSEHPLLYHAPYDAYCFFHGHSEQLTVWMAPFPGFIVLTDIDRV